MNLSYRLVAVDLDETLLGPDHRISSRNARALRAIAERGVACVIASGRMHEATTRFAEQLGLDDPIISYNGAMVRVPSTRETLHHVRVPAPAAATISSYCAENGLHLNFYLDDHLYVAERGEWAEFYLRQTGSPMEVIGSLHRLEGAEPTKLILIDAPVVTERLETEFRSTFGDSLYITRTNPEYLEFMNPSANKGRALELLARRMGIPREQVAAFGDGRNDVLMIRWAGLGVAMGAARAEAIEAADRVAPPYDADGLAVVLEDLYGLRALDRPHGPTPTSPGRLGAPPEVPDSLR